MSSIRLSWYSLVSIGCAALLAACGDGGARDHDVEEGDAAVTADDDASVRDAGARPGNRPDAGGDMDADPETDASEEVDADASEEACPEDQPADECGVCGGDGSSCAPHPLAGTYAVRTQLYARQKTSISGSPLDLVSKMSLLSVAEIGEDGVVNEHYCFLELVSDQDIYIWTNPAGVESTADTAVRLEERDEMYVRPLDQHSALFSWSASAQPEDCVAGEVHDTGCLCAADEGLPTDPNDCRVLDAEGDDIPGGNLYLDLEPAEDPGASTGFLSLSVVASLGLEWRLPREPGERLVGEVEGGLEQSELSRPAEFEEDLGPVLNAMCPGELGHVELVKGEFDCAAIMAGRVEDLTSHGIFDVALDGEPPELDACPDPACLADGDGDGTPDCQDECPDDADKAEPGTCGCGELDADSDGDGRADCEDLCPNDPGKSAPGVCDCGTPDTDGDGDGTPRCVDECDDDAGKTEAGICGCGTPDTDDDGDGTPNCQDGCPSDPNKKADGLCGCGTADTDSDSDGTPDCDDQCPADPGKQSAGTCGCGIPDRDLDGNGSIDCSDLCPQDPNKVAPGICGCGVPDVNSDGDAALDCKEECDNDPNKLVPGQCGCGVAETDGDGDGTPDCIDACPADAGKIKAGVCGCGKPDTDSDGDGTQDCQDQCPNNPKLVTPGSCGCDDCPSLQGTYAMRTSVYNKSIVDGAVSTQKSLGYNLVTFTPNGDGTTRMTLQTCWAQSVPSPDANPAAYTWSRASVLQAVPPSTATLTQNPDGSWVRAAPPAPVSIGWDAARQPAVCTAAATPIAPWPASWGAICTCNDAAFPPFHRGGQPYDCRVTDVDNDGLPGLTAYAATSAPTDPDATAPGLGATVYGVSDLQDRLVIQPGEPGEVLWGNVEELYSMAGVVGCSGLACSALGNQAPVGAACPPALNRAQFVPVTPSFDTCQEIVAGRATIFDTNQDGPWPDDNACPPPQ